MRSFVTFVVAVALVGGVQLASAATIAVAGTDLTGTTAWDTAGYGDDFYAFGVVDSESFTTGGDNAADYNVNYDANGGDAITTVAGTTPANLEIVGIPGVNFTFGLSSGTFGDNLTVTFNTTQDQVTLAVLVGAHEINSNDGTLGSGVNVRDIPQDIKLVGGNTVTVSTGGPEAFTATRPDWYFFSVTSITAGDTVAISSTFVDDSGGNKFGPVNGIGITVVPEPASFALLGIGSLLVARRRR